MYHYEYKHHTWTGDRYSHMFDHDMNEFGREGWELVQILEVDGLKRYTRIYVFKRPYKVG